MPRNPDLQRLLTVVRMPAVLGLAVAALAAGCAGYRLGSTLPPGVRSVYVPTFINKTGEPLLEADTTSATVREFQKDGTLRVVPSADEADLDLTVTLKKYGLEPLRYQSDNSKKAREYRLRIDVEIVCKRKGVEAPMVQKEVYGEATFYPEGGLSSSKQQALPDAAEDLAHNIVESITEAW